MNNIIVALSLFFLFLASIIIGVFFYFFAGIDDEVERTEFHTNEPIAEVKKEQKKEFQQPAADFVEKEPKTEDPILLEDKIVSIDEARLYMGKTVTVEGVVYGVGTNTSAAAYYLSFCPYFNTDRWRDCPYVAYLEERNVHKYPEIKSLVGKTVRVRADIRIHTNNQTGAFFGNSPDSLVVVE